MSKISIKKRNENTYLTLLNIDFEWYFKQS